MSTHLNAYGKKLQKIAKNMYNPIRITLVESNFNIVKYVMIHKNSRKNRVTNAQNIFIHIAMSLT